jgi:hypothetical protein
MLWQDATNEKNISYGIVMVLQEWRQNVATDRGPYLEGFKKKKW